MIKYNNYNLNSYVNRFIAYTFLVLFFSACGYQFSGSGSVLPKDVKSIYVAPVVNNSAQGGLNQTFVSALIDSFERFGVIKVVNTPESADAILSATIVEIVTSTRSVTSNTDTALQSDTTIVVNANLKRTTGTTLWQKKDMQISRTFGGQSSAVVSSSPDFFASGLSSGDLSALNESSLARGQQRNALNLIIKELAERIYEEAVLPEF